MPWSGRKGSNRRKTRVTGTHGSENGPLGRVETGSAMRDLETSNLTWGYRQINSQSPNLMRQEKRQQQMNPHRLWGWLSHKAQVWAGDGPRRLVGEVVREWVWTRAPHECTGLPLPLRNGAFGGVHGLAWNTGRRVALTKSASEGWTLRSLVKHPVTIKLSLESPVALETQEYSAIRLENSI